MFYKRARYSNSIKNYFEIKNVIKLLQNGGSSFFKSIVGLKEIQIVDQPSII